MKKIQISKYEDIDYIAKIASKNSQTLGFVRKTKLIISIQKQQVHVIKEDSVVVGYIHFHVRKDDIITIYELCIDEPFRNKGLGRLLVESVVSIGKDINSSLIKLKCISNTDACDFYEHIGFEHIRTEQGKKNQINIYHYLLPNLFT